MPVGPQHVAAAQNQYEKVAKLLAGGEDPNTQLPTGMTPLHSAARCHCHKDKVAPIPSSTLQPITVMLFFGFF